MYKIYINENPLVICHSEAIGSFKANPDAVIVRYLSKKHLLQHISALESAKVPKSTVIYGDEPKAIFKVFKDLFDVIKAGGGVVVNEYSQILVIYRRGKWDLPKGKRDKGESMKACALREVQEETGVTQLAISHKIGKTYHVYRLKSGNRVLKITKWYYMSAPNQLLEPQAEEQIEQAVWLDVDRIDWLKKSTYANIANIFEEHGAKIINFGLIEYANPRK